MKNVKNFCSEFGISMSDAKNRLFEMEPITCKYFSKNGVRAGSLMPFYFSAVSLVIKDATNVLEIGVGIGRTTNLLANLFPTAMIYAIDIPLNDQDFVKGAGRARLKEEFDRNISRDNIKFIEKNSFFLPSMGLPSEFELIYVDGGHKYPVVAWDTMFAYNSLRPNGFVFFHDYGGGHNHVEAIIKYIKGIIDEEIKFLPNAMPPDRRGIAWFRKSASEEE